jgi:hypothetical protein
MEISIGQNLELGECFPDRVCLLIRHVQRSFSIKLHFRDSKGQLIKTVEANDGDDILSIAHEHDIDLEGATSIISGQFASPTCTRGRCLRRFRCLLHVPRYSLPRTL